MHKDGPKQVKKEENKSIQGTRIKSEWNDKVLNEKREKFKSWVIVQLGLIPKHDCIFSVSNIYQSVILVYEWNACISRKDVM